MLELFKSIEGVYNLIEEYDEGIIGDFILLEEADSQKNA